MTRMFPILIAIGAPLALGACATTVDDDGPAGIGLSAALSGANEVNAQGERNKGDTDGTGSFTGRLIPAQSQLCYSLSWNNIATPAAAHIHTGAAGTNGGVFVPLPDLAPGEHCIAVTPAQATALTATPQNYYVNLHNADFPAGAIRGQLGRS
jgi:hypothetical protein